MSVTLDAERMVLGAMLLHPDAIGDCAEILTGADFQSPHHELIFDAVMALAGRGEPADSLTVADELGADVKKLSGGAAYLFELTGLMPYAGNAGYYADIVHRAALLRRITTVGTRMVELGQANSDADALDVLDAARAELDGLAVREVGESSTEDDVYQAIADLDAPPGVPTPWHELNEIITGWRPGGFYIVGARPAVGKSVIANEALLNMARRGKRAVMFNLEMSKSEIYHRMLCNVGSVDMGRMQHRRLNQAEYGDVAKAAKHISGLPLTVDDRGAIKVAQIRAKVRNLQRREDVGLVVVDYLQLMTGTRRSENRQQEVSEMSRALKLLAKELQVPVLALSQLKRPDGRAADHQPQMSDLRESGSLEQDADVIVLLHRDPDQPDSMDLLVAKNRHGPADRIVTLMWEGHYSRVSDYHTQR